MGKIKGDISQGQIKGSKQTCRLPTTSSCQKIVFTVGIIVSIFLHIRVPIPVQLYIIRSMLLGLLELHWFDFIESHTVY